MALLQTPSFKAQQYRDFEIERPCSGGINLLDLEYEQEPNQSPNVLNMMYRNGAFGKRYGQEYYHDYGDEIYATGYYKGEIIVHAGTKVYRGSEVIFDGIPTKKGLFFNFNRMFYYINDKFYVMGNNDNTFKEVEPYVPELVINRTPDGKSSDPIENYNRVGKGFKNTFHGDGTSKEYILTDKDLDETTPIVEVDGEVLETGWTIDYKEGKITFDTAPVKGTNNVVITIYKTQQEYIDSILACKYAIAYGGNNNSRLFLAGGGNSTYYYSAVFDATYFPDSNDATIGNGEEDITGFGEQYDVLLVFKPREIYALDYYLDSEGIGQFSSKIVNAKVGCDCPNTIQLINNQLTWLSTINGVCTLVSTNIEDERNIRPISRNINGGYRKKGLLQEPNLKQATSVDWDNKYILSVNGNAYVWDYAMTPYSNTGKIDTDAKRLAWFLFDNFNVAEYIKDERDLYYSSGTKLVKLNDAFNDFDMPIKATYQTPLLQFGAEEYLKTIKNVYIQCRGDTATRIDMSYITEETPNGEKESEPIVVYGKLWRSFSWDTFGWDMLNFANVFRRKCSIKKIQMMAILFENDINNSDMSITHLGFQFTIVKNVK